MTSDMKELLAQGFIPPWMDKEVLCLCLSGASPTTIDAWVNTGVLPPPKKRGGKLMWKWSEVDNKLTVGEAGGSPDSQADRIRLGTKRASMERHANEF